MGQSPVKKRKNLKKAQLGIRTLIRSSLLVCCSAAPSPVLRLAAQNPLSSKPFLPRRPPAPTATVRQPWPPPLPEGSLALRFPSPAPTSCGGSTLPSPPPPRRLVPRIPSSAFPRAPPRVATSFLPEILSITSRGMFVASPQFYELYCYSVRDEWHILLAQQSD